jgi:hypothetical protein
MSDEPSAREVAEASAEVAAVVEALAPEPDVYISSELGPTPVDAMHPEWARNASAAVKRGDRPIEPRGVTKALDKRGRQ